MKDFLNNWKIALLKARFKRALNPDQAFLKSAREKFLNSIAPAPAPIARPAHYHAVRLGYAFAVALLIVGGTGSLAAFADYKDVAVTNPLYNLKRASEQTRLALTPEEKKPVAHVALAERRLKELEQVQVEVKAKAVAPTRTVTPKPVAEVRINAKQQIETLSAQVTPTALPIEKKLDRDLRKEVENIFPATASASRELKFTQARLCRALSDAIKKGVIDQPRASVIEKRCEPQD